MAKQPKEIGIAPSSRNKQFAFETADVDIAKLLLDPNNYRFLDRRKFKKKAATRFHEISVQRATLDTLEQSYQLEELKQSIMVNGYVPMERIIVTPYAPKSGWYLVVEGNRRVAALKSLIKESQDGVIQLTAAQRQDFSTVPCAVLKSTGTALKHAERVIMGIRHITGPREWGAYQQALLVRELKDDEGRDFSSIAETLGISSMEAARRYRAIKALNVMEQDELYSRKAEPNFYKLFHELVSIPTVRERFGWSSDENTFTEKEKAQEFFGLITSDGEHDPKLQTFGDVRKLRVIVGNSKAEESLFNLDEPLNEAIRIGELGKQEENPTELLAEAKSRLAEISIIHVEQLGPEDLVVINELISMLTRLKKVMSTLQR